MIEVIEEEVVRGIEGRGQEAEAQGPVPKENLGEAEDLKEREDLLDQTATERRDPIVLKEEEEEEEIAEV